MIIANVNATECHHAEIRAAIEAMQPVTVASASMIVLQPVPTSEPRLVRPVYTPSYQRWGYPARKRRR